MRLIYRLRRETDGAAATITALFLVAAVGMMSMAIDLGHIFLVKNELQRAADAGAMAGALGLVARPSGTSGRVLSLTPSCTNAFAATHRVVTANDADGASLTLPTADVIFGTWDLATKSFVATGCGNPKAVTAVKVITRKDGTANGPVPLSFFGLLPGGYATKDLTAQAIGLTGYAGYAPPGAGVFPIAIDVDKVPPNNSTFRIHLNPNGADDGAWHSYTFPNTNANDLRQFIDGSKATPPIAVGDQIYVQNGVDDSVLQEINRQLNSHGGTWDVLVPIIPTDAHTGSAEVLGFAALEITDIVSQGGDKYIECHLVPDYVAPALVPGGPNYGLWAGSPKMVL